MALIEKLKEFLCGRDIFFFWVLWGWINSKSHDTFILEEFLGISLHYKDLQRSHKLSSTQISWDRFCKFIFWGSLMVHSWTTILNKNRKVFLCVPGVYKWQWHLCSSHIFWGLLYLRRNKTERLYFKNIFMTLITTVNWNCLGEWCHQLIKNLRCMVKTILNLNFYKILMKLKFINCIILDKSQFL